MDKIDVKDSALEKAIKILYEFSENSTLVSSNLEQELADMLRESRDKKFDKEVSIFIENLRKFDSAVRNCAEHNVKALKERLSIISDYSKKTYKKMNLG